MHQLCLRWYYALILPHQHLKENQTSSFVCLLSCQCLLGISPHVETRLIMTQQHCGGKTLAFNLLVATFFRLTFSSSATVSLNHPGVSVLHYVTTFVPTLYTQILLSQPRCVQQVPRLCHTCCQKSFIEQQCSFTTARSKRQNFCMGLVTSNCLIQPDAHSEQIRLNLDRIKVFKPFLWSCFIWCPFSECSVTAGLAPPFSKHYPSLRWLGPASEATGNCRGLRAVLTLCEGLRAC